MAGTEGEPLVGGLVMVALDGSHHAEKALKWYAEHFHQGAYTILILNVSDPPFVKAEQMMYMSKGLWQELIDKEKEKFKNVELYYAKFLETHNICGRIKTVFYNDHAVGILETAKAEGAMMIVVGSHGKGVEQKTLGGVAQRVLERATCPVLVWRHDHCSHTTQHWDKVLVYM